MPIDHRSRFKKYENKINRNDELHTTFNISENIALKTFKLL